MGIGYLIGGVANDAGLDVYAAERVQISDLPMHKRFQRIQTCFQVCVAQRLYQVR